MPRTRLAALALSVALAAPVVPAATVPLATAAPLTATAPESRSLPRASDDLADAALDIAASRDWGGQCKGFVQQVHSAAGRGSLGLGYYSAYPSSGYVRVGARHARRGDIVQFYFNSWSTAHGIHTAILLGRVEGGGAKVVDSNWVGPEQIGVHWLDIDGRVASISGLRVAFWRWAG